MKSFKELNKDWKDTDDWGEYSEKHADEIQEMMESYFMGYGFEECSPGVYIDETGIEIILVDEIFYQVYVRGEYWEFQGWNELFEMLPNIIKKARLEFYVPRLIELSEEFQALNKEIGLISIHSSGEVHLTEEKFRALFDEYQVKKKDYENYTCELHKWVDGTLFFCLSKEAKQ